LRDLWRHFHGRDTGNFLPSKYPDKRRNRQITGKCEANSPCVGRDGLGQNPPIRILALTIRFDFDTSMAGIAWDGGS
jgi:hypothetical protein